MAHLRNNHSIGVGGPVLRTMADVNDLNFFLNDPVDDDMGGAADDDLPRASNFAQTTSGWQ